MRSELAWLVDFFFQCDGIDPKLREILKERVVEVTEHMHARPQSPIAQIPYPGLRHDKTQQAPSTLALMAKHGDIGCIPPGPLPELPFVEPVAIVAQTPATVAALQSREAAISAALSGKIDKVSGRPRKF